MIGNLPRNSELFISLFVIAIALLLLVPLPTIILDFLLVINLGIAFFLLLVVLYLPNAVQLLAFPTLLLLTTLFRLGLNVASTRLILSQGDAGQVIEAFGTFLVGGELVVGIVVFGIITIINLLVIARGAGRISEVAARFALDSLPGKQMSIDADLRAGLIAPQEAERRRDQLRKESQLYGSMDGAMKFVQGDAIAGIVIIFTNVIGGLSLGLFHGMPLGEAITTYTTLTVGDGLVSQIPAFLIAICAGLVVTRIGTSSDSTFGSDLRSQLLGQPAVLLVVSGLLFVLAFVEGMPRVPFITMSLVCLGFWYQLKRQNYPNREGSSLSNPVLLGSDEAPLQISYDGSGSFTLAMGRSRVSEDLQRTQHRLQSKWAEFSKEGQFYFGLVLPMPRIEIDSTFSAREYELRKGPQPLFRYSVPLDALFAPIHPTQAKALGLNVVQEEQTPVFGGLGSWIVGDRTYVDRMLSCYGVRPYAWIEFVGLQLFSYCRLHPEEVITMSYLHSQLKELENIQPGLVSDAFEQSNMTVSRLLNIMHQLLKEGLPAMSLLRLIEEVTTYYSTAGGGFSGEADEFDMADLTSFLRQRNKERLLGSQLTGGKSLRVIRMSRAVEDILLKAGGRLMGGGSQLSRGDYRELRESLESNLSPARQRGILPLSIQCPEMLRVPLFHFLHSLPFTVPMICEEEIELKTSKVVLSEWSVASD
ncbi:MAG: FHIPEP family type III secretion protein [Bdellovibrionales bacterium]|nr:FHIPEP family type III secretion protein [Bdellovibrionales bacterium]